MAQGIKTADCTAIQSAMDTIINDMKLSADRRRSLLNRLEKVIIKLRGSIPFDPYDVKGPADPNSMESSVGELDALSNVGRIHNDGLELFINALEEII